jgi:small GTP-binding protein
MIQKKVCMVGVHGTGKTSLVHRFVHSRFSERYLSTVGVKIDRKVVEIEGESVTMILWDLAGRDKQEDINANYLKGAHGILYVADGTRKETCDQIGELQDIARKAVGDVPSVIALNKSDLVEQWALRPQDEAKLKSLASVVRTSAKSGLGVEEAFRQLGAATLRTGGARA